MFPIYPGFEELPIRVEVEWHGRTRPVMARLEQWPESGNAVLVCGFTDDEADGEWIVIGSGGLIPYQRENPYNLVQDTQIYQVATRFPLLRWKRQGGGEGRVKEVVCKAFGDNTHFNVARLLHLSDIPNAPRIALRTNQKSSWLPDYSHQSWVEFAGQTSAQPNESQSRQQLLDEWNENGSDARFSWEWVALDDKQRINLLGFTGDRQELERVMSLVLTAKRRDWREDDWLMWQLDINKETGQFYGSFGEKNSHNAQKENHALSLWDELLLTRCASDWRPELVTRHECVRQYLREKYYEFGYAIGNQAPTAHEQLEAKLQLREWLQDKAPPAQIAELLDI